jgi:hypothetical protein
LPRHTHAQRGEKENIFAITGQANGSISRYYSDRVAYGTNCQQVVQAAELRARGFDVMAKARRSDYTNDVVNDGWKYADGRIPRITFNTNLADIQSILANYAEGERAWVMCRWKSGGSHIFNVGIENGEVVWYDAQIHKVVSRAKQGIVDPGMLVFKTRTQDRFGWGLIEHTETLIPDDRVLRNVEPFKSS